MGVKGAIDSRRLGTLEKGSAGAEDSAVLFAFSIGFVVFRLSLVLSVHCHEH